MKKYIIMFAIVWLAVGMGIVYAKTASVPVTATYSFLYPNDTVTPATSKQVLITYSNGKFALITIANLDKQITIQTNVVAKMTQKLTTLTTEKTSILSSLNLPANTQ